MPLTRKITYPTLTILKSDKNFLFHVGKQMLKYAILLSCTVLIMACQPTDATNSNQSNHIGETTMSSKYPWLDANWRTVEAMEITWTLVEIL